MIRIRVQFIFGLLLSFPLFLGAQDFTSEQKEMISEIKKLMDDDELTDLVEAENSFEEGNFIIDQVENEEFTLEKYFEGSNLKKAEKKAVNVKAQRIEAARVYERAYVLMQGALESRLGKGMWEFEEDEKEATAMRESSTTKMTEASAKTEDYKYLGEDDLETYPYEDLKSSIANAMAMFKEAIHYQFDAYAMLLNQQDKKQKIADDNFAWGIAQRDNSVDAYQKYLSAYPSGIHVEDANAAISALESGAPVTDSVATIAEVVSEENIEPVMEPAEEPAVPVQDVITPVAVADIPEETPTEPEPVAMSEPEPVSPIAEALPVAETPVATASVVPGVVFRIQLIAVRRQMSQEEIASLYSGSEKVTEREEGGLHKYSVGEFTSFNAAKEFRNSLSVPNFIVAFRDGERIPINEAFK